MIFKFILFNSLLDLFALQISSVAGDPCSDFVNNFVFENATVLGATHVVASSNISTLGSCQSSAVIGLSAVCRVEIAVNTTTTSATQMEIWFPDPDDWSGRLLSLGNGGLGGCIDYTNLAYGTTLHFATIASDNGHDGNSGAVFLDKPEVINDFAFRAIHVEVMVAKAAIKTFYGEAQHHSYYLGCSTGGRQGMKSALSFPEDFDGIVAGAPAVDFNRLTDWQGLLGTFIGAPNADTSASFIPATLWPVISQEILRQCDILDGVSDGIITEPDECAFRAEALVCMNNTTTACVSPAQIDALNRVYQPLFGPTGTLLFPRLDPGAEADGNFQSLLSGTFFSIFTDWFKFAIFNDSTHDFSNFGFGDVSVADKINPGGIATWSGELSAFKDRGGKIITYHGRRDQLIASGNSKRFYNLISQTLGLPVLDSFYRLFLVPGMNHCSGGPGAWMFGQTGTAVSPINDTAHNVLLAMVDWVESDHAPEVIVGFNPTNVTEQERAHCRFPQRSVRVQNTWKCVV